MVPIPTKCKVSKWWVLLLFDALYKKILALQLDIKENPWEFKDAYSFDGHAL